MILYTFLEQRDLSGKTIIPFCTHGGSGFSRTIETIRKKQPGKTCSQRKAGGDSEDKCLPSVCPFPQRIRRRSRICKVRKNG